MSTIIKFDEMMDKYTTALGLYRHPRLTSGVDRYFTYIEEIKIENNPIEGQTLERVYVYEKMILSQLEIRLMLNRIETDILTEMIDAFNMKGFDESLAVLHRYLDEECANCSVSQFNCVKGMVMDYSMCEKCEELYCFDCIKAGICLCCRH